MFAVDLHLGLALLSTAVMTLVTIEGGLRAARSASAGAWSERLGQAVTLLLVATAGAGLAMVTTGRHPHEWFHLMYAALAFASILTGDHLARTWQARNQGLMRLGSGLFAMVVLYRLFATG